MREEEGNQDAGGGTPGADEEHPSHLTGGDVEQRDKEYPPPLTGGGVEQRDGDIADILFTCVNNQTLTDLTSPHTAVTSLEGHTFHHPRYAVAAPTWSNKTQWPPCAAESGPPQGVVELTTYPEDLLTNNALMDSTWSNETQEQRCAEESGPPTGSCRTDNVPGGSHHEKRNHGLHLVE